MTTITRFAPSPTGRLHIGNARTALFNSLLAWRESGEMILRLEDTDRERSRADFERGIFEELRWLGLEWRQGPDTGGPHAPYRQSERQSLYDGYYRQLRDAGLAYPCFCSQETLKLARKALLAAGKPPRYAGTCANLSEDEIASRIAAGRPATLRFRVPDGETVTFDDIVRGEQRFATSDIGDFVIRRADGTPSFFFSNAVDDALMGVTHALRGEDHLANTPRQILLLRALDLPPPRYGHFPLVLDTDGGPLSKRLGSLGLADLRERGFLPLALANYLARLGHSYAEEKFRDLQELAKDFDANRFGRAPAKYDPDQLRHWQKEAMLRLDDEAFEAWLLAHAGPHFAALDAEARRVFTLTVRDNVALPPEARRMAERLLGDDIGDDAEAIAAIREAGGAFFRDAGALLDDAGDFAEFSKAVGMKTGRNGRALFMPLRAALSGETHGPEMARIWRLLGKQGISARLLQAAEIAEQK